MDIKICCNTDDDQLFANIEFNSRLDLPWVSKLDAHDGHAVLVGGGPSAAKHLDGIRWRQSQGQKVFALNGAAQWLYSHGILADYLVVVDAREHNKRFATFPWAKHFLFASQCHPALVTQVQQDKLTLWHPVLEGIEDHIDDPREFALVGGGTTVGLSAMALVHTMGYRKLHLYGYDSSHSEKRSHAYPQPENDRIPDCEVTLLGRTFKASLAMAKQAELFPELCNTLIDMGAVITCDGDGLIPWIAQNMRAMPEAQKYQAMWDLPAYREVAPGEFCADAFLAIAKPFGTVADFGCGTGRGALKLALSGLAVTLVDFTENSRDEAARSLPFVQCDFSEQAPPIRVDYGYCTDVMEHIPPDKVDRTIHNLFSASGRFFFAISTVPDQMGALIGQDLHLTVQPFDWWFAKFESLGYAVQWAQKEDTAALFYVTTHKESQ